MSGISGEDEGMSTVSATKSFVSGLLKAILIIYGKIAAFISSFLSVFIIQPFFSAYVFRLISLTIYAKSICKVYHKNQLVSTVCIFYTNKNRNNKSTTKYEKRLIIK